MLIHEPLAAAAARTPDAVALRHRKTTISYAELWSSVRSLAGAITGLGIDPGDRVAIWLPKQPETVIGIYAAALAGGCFVPVNPVLKPRQVAYQLTHSDARVLITSGKRLDSLKEAIRDNDALEHVILVDREGARDASVHALADLMAMQKLGDNGGHRRIDADMAAILYTSGSTGMPKGVVVSHRNLVAGGRSVASYLGNGPQDRILSVLPLSFDAGLSQLTTAFWSGASVTLMEYLLPRDVIRAIERDGITGMTAVPPLWNALAKLEWPDSCGQSLRYIANTGGAMPEQTTRRLAALLPDTDIFLMYGLTEAFRSTFLPPAMALHKPTSVGRAIPEAEVLVINSEGKECAPGEHGELVHRGVHVALGYWKNPEATAERFKPATWLPSELPCAELAVWSGDTAYRDEDGDIYFVSRSDAMIKSSGYRISPSEVEAEALAVEGVNEAVAIGAPHPEIGQAVVLFVAADEAAEALAVRLGDTLKSSLPAFMLPRELVIEPSLPLNPNGKVDRTALAASCADMFTGGAS